MKTIESRVSNHGDLGKYAPGLKEAREKLEAAARAYADAVRAEAEAGADLNLARADWQRQYRRSYGALMALFGDRARAESYFLQPRTSRRGGHEEEREEAAAPAGG